MQFADSGKSAVKVQLRENIIEVEFSGEPFLPLLTTHRSLYDFLRDTES